MLRKGDLSPRPTVCGLPQLFSSVEPPHSERLDGIGVLTVLVPAIGGE